MQLKDGGEVHADVLVGADGIWSQASKLNALTNRVYIYINYNVLTK